MDKIIPAFEVSLLEPVFSSSIQITELGIDSLLDDGFFKAIPIVNVLVGIGKTAQNIHDRNLLKQTLVFIKTFNAQNINQEKLAKYKEAISENQKKAEDELGRVVIILNTTLEVAKSKLLAKIFESYVEEIISWDKFCELSDVITRLFLADVDLLIKIFNKDILDTTQCFGYQVDRLISIGLVDATTKSVSIGESSSRTDRYVLTSNLGNLFCRIII